jgi:hypothetical protein
LVRRAHSQGYRPMAAGFDSRQVIIRLLLLPEY